MPDNYAETIEQWRNRLGAGKPFHEQDLWKERAPIGKHDRVAYCGMDKRLRIKRILIAAMQAKLVECVGPGQWSIVE